MGLSDHTWQYRLETLFTAPLDPPTVQAREPYWHENDIGLHSPDQNMILRFRSYQDDGHAARQEAVFSSGQRTGQLLRGNDQLLDKSVHMTYGDVILHVGDYVHVKTAGMHNLLWNGTPFNPTMNPYFQMPDALRTAEDAFQFAIASIPGSDAVKNVTSLLGLAGGPSLKTPFDVYTALTPQKVLKINEFAIQALKMLLPLEITGRGASSADTANNSKNPITKAISGGFPPTPHAVSPIPPAFLPLGFPFIPPGQPIPSGTPLQYSPQFIAMATMAQAQLDTIYETSTEASGLGKQVQQLIASAVPGLGPVIGAFG